MRARTHNNSILKYTRFNTDKFPLNRPKFPYAYHKSARVTFLDAVHDIRYDDMDYLTQSRCSQRPVVAKRPQAPDPIDVPIPERLLTMAQLNHLFHNRPMFIGWDKK